MSTGSVGEPAELPESWLKAWRITVGVTKTVVLGAWAILGLLGAHAGRNGPGGGCRSRLGRGRRRRRGQQGKRRRAEEQEQQAGHVLGDEDGGTKLRISEGHVRAMGLGAERFVNVAPVDPR